MNTYLTRTAGFLPMLLVLLAASLFAITIFCSFAQPVFANGSHPNSQIVYSTEDKNYDIQVETVPVLGLMHFTVTVVDPDTGKRLPSLSVHMTFLEVNGTNSEPSIEVSAIPTDLGGYSTDVQITTAGTWLVSITLSEPSGQTTYQFEMQVFQTSSAIWPLMILGSVVLFLVIWIRYRSHKRKSNKMDLPNG